MTIEAIYFLLFIHFIFALGLSVLGRKRKLGLGGSFLVSFLFGPIIGMMIVLMSDEKVPGKSVETDLEGTTQNKT